jgi:hypothetical protein
MDHGEVNPLNPSRMRPDFERRPPMSLMLASNIAGDTAVTSVIVGLLIWAIAAEACGAWKVALPRGRTWRSGRFEPVALGVT